MDDECLKDYLPAFGDRLAARAFCRCQTKNEKPSSSLLERLRTRLSRKKKSVDDNPPSKKRNNAHKDTRKLEVGWMDFDYATKELKQVRSQGGGGTREIRANKSEGLDNLLATAKGLFFPDGKSKRGKIEDYEVDIQDFRGCEMGNSTVGELYENAKSRVLRLYLCTKKKNRDQPSTETSSDNQSENQPEEESDSSDCYVVQFGRKSDEGTQSQLDETLPLNLEYVGGCMIDDDCELPPIHLGFSDFEGQSVNPQRSTNISAEIQPPNQAQATDNGAHTQPRNQTLATDNRAQTQPGNLQQSTDNRAQAQPGNLQQATDNRAQTQPGNLHQATDNRAQTQPGNLHQATENGDHTQPRSQQQADAQIQRANPQQAAIDYDLQLDDAGIPSDTKALQICLHRSNIQAEMIALFKTPEILSIQLKVTFVEELGVDARGVSREAYSAFWNSFFNTSADGEDYRVPSLNPEYGLEEWLSIGRILSKGYSDHNIFPVQLAPAFLIAVMFGEETVSTEDLLETFLLFLSPLERATVKQALQGDVLSDDEQDIFEDILDREGCHSIPKGENVRPTIYQLAHKVIIQKSMYALEGMRKVVRDALHSAFPDVNSIKIMYGSLKPTPKKVCDLLAANPQTREEAQSLRFLQQYIRAQNEEGLGTLLRFLTASPVMTATQISVQFTNTTGLARRPVAHTCGPMLELPTSYTSYRDFRSEWQAVLSSGYLAMDIA